MKACEEMGKNINLASAQWPLTYVEYTLEHSQVLFSCDGSNRRKTQPHFQRIGRFCGGIDAELFYQGLNGLDPSRHDNVSLQRAQMRLWMPFDKNILLHCKHFLFPGRVSLFCGF